MSNSKPSRKRLHSVECLVMRLTNRAVLLSPLGATAADAVDTWFPLSEIEPDHTELYQRFIDNQAVEITIPEWLIVEKRWDMYI